MSNTQPPPSYGGHPSYAQWPPPYPGMMPPNFHPSQYSPTAPPHLVNPGQPFQYNMDIDPNATVPVPPPGAPNGPGLFYPPPFPYMPQLDGTQLPPLPYPPVAMPPLGYPQVPAPPGSSHPPPGPRDAHSADASRAQNSQVHTRATSYTGSNHEEGEISDAESRPVYKATKTLKSAKRPSLGQSSSAPRYDLEEGEAVSSRSSSRSSSRMCFPTRLIS